MLDEIILYTIFIEHFHFLFSVNHNLKLLQIIELVKSKEQRSKKKEIFFKRLSPDQSTFVCFVRVNCIPAGKINWHRRNPKIALRKGEKRRGWKKERAVK